MGFHCSCHVPTGSVATMVERTQVRIYLERVLAISVTLNYPIQKTKEVMKVKIGILRSCSYILDKI